MPTLLAITRYVFFYTKYPISISFVVNDTVIISSYIYKKYCIIQNRASYNMCSSIYAKARLAQEKRDQSSQ